MYRVEKFWPIHWHAAVLPAPGSMAADETPCTYWLVTYTCTRPKKASVRMRMGDTATGDEGVASKV